MRKRDELTNPKSCMSRAKEGEMMFVLLGRDDAAPATIKFWIQERVRLGKNLGTDQQIVEAFECAVQMQVDKNPVMSDAPAAPPPVSQEAPVAPDCPHSTLRFGSGMYYVFCVDCCLGWVLKRPENDIAWPEGQKIPTAWNGQYPQERFTHPACVDADKVAAEIIETLVVEYWPVANEQTCRSFTPRVAAIIRKHNGAAVPVERLRTLRDELLRMSWGPYDNPGKRITKLIAEYDKPETSSAG